MSGSVTTFFTCKFMGTNRLRMVWKVFWNVKFFVFFSSFFCLLTEMWTWHASMFTKIDTMEGITALQTIVRNGKKRIKRDRATAFCHFEGQFERSRHQIWDSVRKCSCASVVKGKLKLLYKQKRYQVLKKPEKHEFHVNSGFFAWLVLFDWNMSYFHQNLRHGRQYSGRDCFKNSEEMNEKWPSHRFLPFWKPIQLASLWNFQSMCAMSFRIRICNQFSNRTMARRVTRVATFCANFARKQDGRFQLNRICGAVYGRILTKLGALMQTAGG